MQFKFEYCVLHVFVYNKIKHLSSMTFPFQASETCEFKLKYNFLYLKHQLFRFVRVNE